MSILVWMLYFVLVSCGFFAAVVVLPFYFYFRYRYLQIRDIKNHDDEFDLRLNTVEQQVSNIKEYLFSEQKKLDVKLDKLLSKGEKNG